MVANSACKYEYGADHSEGLHAAHMGGDWAHMACNRAATEAHKNANTICHT